MIYPIAFIIVVLLCILKHCDTIDLMVDDNGKLYTK